MILGTSQLRGCGGAGFAKFQLHPGKYGVFPSYFTRLHIAVIGNFIFGVIRAVSDVTGAPSTVVAQPIRMIQQYGPGAGDYSQGTCTRGFR
jgi:hypothetical protein